MIWVRGHSLTSYFIIEDNTGTNEESGTSRFFTFGDLARIPGLANRVLRRKQLICLPTASQALETWLMVQKARNIIYSLLPLYFPQFRVFSEDQEKLYFPRKIKYFIQLVKTQQSIYSTKTVDKVGKVNKTTYLPVEN